MIYIVVLVQVIFMMMSIISAKNIHGVGQLLLLQSYENLEINQLFLKLIKDISTIRIVSKIYKPVITSIIK